MRLLTTALALVTAAAIGASATTATAQDFYAGKTIDVIVGTGVGGGYDQYARLLASHLGRHLAGSPTLVPQNMPGAGGRQAINTVYNVSSRDGTVISTVPRGIPFDPLYGSDAAQFDAEQLTWIGSLNNEVVLCVVWHDKPVKTVEDARTTELFMGTDGPTTNTTVMAKLLNELAGTRLNLIHGFPGSAEIHLAMERGEVDGRCGLGWDSIVSRYPHWLENDQISILAQFGLYEHPDLPDVPSIMTFADTDEKRELATLLIAPQEMGRPFFAPPGLPAERVEELRRAFDAMAQDEAFLADAAQQNLPIVPMTGEEVEELVRALYATSSEVVGQAAAILSGE